MLEFLVALVIFGAVLYLIGLIPMDPAIAKVVRVIAIVIVVLYAVNFLMHGGGSLPRWR